MNDPRKNFRKRIWDVLKHPASATAQARQKLKYSLWEMIDQGKGVAGRRVNGMIFFLIIISILILPLELIPELARYHTYTEIIEIVITAIFSLEYMIRIYAAPRKLRYIFSIWGIIDLISILPYYLSLAQMNTQLFRFLRIARIVRILKLARIRSPESVEDEVKKKSLKTLQLMDGEEIEHVVMRHPVFLILSFILPLILGSVAIVIALLFNFHQVALTFSGVIFLIMLLLLYKAWNDYHFDALYITNQRIIFQNSYILGQSQNQVDFLDISNIRPAHTSILSYVFGFGSIIVETASDQSIIEHKNVKNHEKFAQYIYEKMKKKKESIS